MSKHVSIQKASNGFVVTDYDDRCADLPTIQIADNFATACGHAAGCLGVTYTVGGHGDDGAKELQRLVDSLRDTIKKKNMEIASLMAVSGILGVDYEKVLSAPAADEAEEERKKPVTPERHGMDSVRQTEGSGPL